MIKISDSYKEQIWEVFKYNAFRGRDKESILKVLNTKAKGSDTITLIPKVGDIKVKNIDVIHDKLTLCFEDMEIDYTMTWKPSGNVYVLVGIE